MIFTRIILLLFFISACSEQSTTEKIHVQIENMQQAINDKSLSDFMSYFYAGFIGNKKLSKPELRQLIYFHFRRNRNIETYKWQADITIENNIAEVEIFVIVTGSNESLPERARIYTIKTIWTKSDSSDELWLISKADWEIKSDYF